MIKLIIIVEKNVNFNNRLRWFYWFSLSKKTFQEDHEIIGIDNLNNYYDVNLKKSRLDILKKLSLEKNVGFKFYKIDLENREELKKIFHS